MAITYEPLASTVLASATSSITFGNISNAYTDLRLVLVGKVATANANIIFTFNSLTTGYSQTNIYRNGTSNGSSITSDRLSNFDGWYPTQADLGSTTKTSLYTLDLFSYAGSTYKTGLFVSNQDQDNAGAVLCGVGLWRNTSAITSITATQSSNFAAGTTANLYGILKA